MIIQTKRLEDNYFKTSLLSYTTTMYNIHLICPLTPQHWTTQLMYAIKCTKEFRWNKKHPGHYCLASKAAWGITTVITSLLPNEERLSCHLLNMGRNTFPSHGALMPVLMDVARRLSPAFHWHHLDSTARTMAAVLTRDNQENLESVFMKKWMFSAQKKIIRNGKDSLSINIYCSYIAMTDSSVSILKSV